MINFVIDLPEEIKIKISSYLYFSNENAKYMTIVNGIVNNYSFYLLREMKILYENNIDVLLLRLLLFIYTSPNIIFKQQKYNSQFYNEYYHENISSKLLFIESLMNNMNVIENQKAYKFVTSYIS